MAEKVYNLKPDDGWHNDGTEKRHYYFKNRRMCDGEQKPANAHHDNDPEKYCDDCSRKCNLVNEKDAKIWDDEK